MEIHTGTSANSNKYILKKYNQEEEEKDGKK